MNVSLIHKRSACFIASKRSSMNGSCNKKHVVGIIKYSDRFVKVATVIVIFTKRHTT
jgi:hypothetical protein